MTSTTTPLTVWSAYEEDGEGELYVDLATAQQGAIGIWGKVCRENEEEPNGVYTWAVMKNGGWELLDGRDHTSVYVAECKVHATPVDYTAVRPCGCPARIERHNYGCKEASLVNSTSQPTTPDLDDDVFDDREPCGENMCHCDCGQGHVCACDCWRCGYCGQHADHCQCDEEA